MNISPTFRRQLAVGLVCSLWAAVSCADGDSSSHQGGDLSLRPTLEGAQVYQKFCAACHMADGRGAQGAGQFPALADNPRLAAPGYPIYVVLNGLGAMPWFNGILKDEEIAAVVTHIRTHFGNAYTEPVKIDEVTGARGPVPDE